ncbi:iron-containing alcohol dehydrogenase [Prosthecobacter sp.]|uniref:iron-containing alcohol dehydrogenase n=1 Tax=Prosthecobacter sp. TaxID=1965333 RepID=UPI003782E66C
MNRFEFATAQRIIFGRGTFRELPDLCRSFGQRPLLITGSRPQQYAERLPNVGIHSICGEPTVEDIESGVALARQRSADVIVAIGGGSVVDAGKAIAAMSTQPGDLMRYIEVIGEGKPLDAASLPYIAVPTTAGTGTEATRNAVIASTQHRVKASLRHISMLPRVALIDPELAADVPSSVTAASGMDALTQCLEAFVCSRAQPMTDALCLDGIQRAVRSLERAFQNGHDLDAREDMALCALNSGIALANAGLGAVHGFAAPIGGMFHAPHGAVCAALLAPVWEANARRVQDRSKFAQVDGMLGGDAVSCLHALTERLRIPKLGHWGIVNSDLDEIARKAAAASSMKANPVALTHEELIAVLRQAL